ncbi:MAG: cytochrome c-type biogenesis protein CcmH [Woeseiaceae bacterium]|nr:cytochrome c-type biogenesis protein CcmH [Woeseiaceae bacterium]
MKLLLSLLATLFLASTAFAIDADEPLEDPGLQARYEEIIEEIRCLKCQNATIKDSPAFLATDLRREIKRMLVEGYTDEQIFDFMVERYGDFALYSPRASGKTLLLWVVPVALLLLGALALANIVRRRMAMPIDDEPDSGS